jgi:hypothetical protein
MVFVILISWIFLLVPLGCFLAAKVAEIRSQGKGPYFFLRMAEIAAGVIALLLGGVSVFSKYSSRGARF